MKEHPPANVNAIENLLRFLVVLILNNISQAKGCAKYVIGHGYSPFRVWMGALRVPFMVGKFSCEPLT